MTIRLLVVDEHEMVRAGLKSLTAGTEIKIVAEAAHGDAAIRLLQKHRPNVVLMDIRMPRGDGLNALSRIKSGFPRAAVLIFSGFDNPSYVARAIALGAKGYVLKGTTRQELLEAIRAAARGEAIWSRQQLRRANGQPALPKVASDIDVSLTPRESEALRLLAAGRSNKEIAQLLQISEETVKEHVQNVLRKIGVADRTQAAVWAVRKKIV